MFVLSTLNLLLLKSFLILKYIYNIGYDFKDLVFEGTVSKNVKRLYSTWAFEYRVTINPVNYLSNLLFELFLKLLYFRNIMPV